MRFKRYKNWAILPKIMMLTVVSVLLIGGVILGYFLPLVERLVMAQKRELTRNVVQVAYHTLVDYGERVRTGELTREEAQRRAVADIRDLRYREKDYFWINDLGPRMIMHPTKPELDGTDLSNNKDPNGKLLFCEFVRVARDKGAGFVDYMWPKPGEAAPVAKVSYVQLYEPWGWIIGSGIYVDDVKHEIAALRWKILLATLLIASAMLTLAASVGYAITRPLRRVMENLHDMSSDEGDLTKRIVVECEDESGDLARSFNHFLDKLQGVIQQVAESAEHLTLAAGRVHASAEQMATGTEEVAAQTGAVATAGEEMAATSAEVAQNCVRVAESAKLANDAAMAGSAVVEQTIQGMNRIAERVKVSADSVATLGSRSDQIGEIVGTIEDIADQTNLLALNAAIEAARAGEQGRGFAVVADEVRALAERTTKATKEIGKMIKAIQQETKGAVASMNDGVKEVAKGSAEAAKSGDALREILNQTSSVTSQISQIATATEQQTATTCEISNNIHQITEVILATARETQESVAAAGQMAKLAETLRRLVGKFRLAA